MPGMRVNAGGQFRVEMFRVFCVLQIIREGGRDVTQTLHTAQMSCCHPAVDTIVGTVASMDSCGSCQF